MCFLSLSLSLYIYIYDIFIFLYLTYPTCISFVWIFVHQPPEKRSLNQTWIPVKVQRISSSRHLSCCRINLGTTSKQVIQGPAGVKGKDLKINMSYGYDCVFIIFYHKEYILKKSYTFGGRYHFSSTPMLFFHIFSIFWQVATSCARNNVSWWFATSFLGRFTVGSPKQGCWWHGQRMVPAAKRCNRHGLLNLEKLLMERGLEKPKPVFCLNDPKVELERNRITCRRCQ